MILRPKPPAHLHAAPSAAAPPAPVPDWLRHAVARAQGLAAEGAGPQALDDVALVAGAAVATLDAVVRRQERWAGAWRRRLALAAAAATARQAGRAEDEAALRDAVLLTKAGDDVGPAGRMVLAWRRLAARPAQDLPAGKDLGAVLEEFGRAPDDEALVDLAADLRRLAAGGTAETPAGAFAAAGRYGLGRAVGAWLADALLARRLGWTHAVPLLGAEAGAGFGVGRQRRPGTVAAGVEDEGARARGLLAAQAHAALRAVDLSAELGRRSERLLAVAPRLRARASGLVVGKLLSDDAIVASDKVAGMSDRGLRRLFDRLVGLGAVRELSGRSAFRIYGL